MYNDKVGLGADGEEPVQREAHGSIGGCEVDRDDQVMW